jgi:DNA-binding NtrC family response regulator
VILLTAWTHLETAVDLVKAGAADYLAKPWDDRKLLATVNNLLELGESRRELRKAREGERGLRRAMAGFDLRGYVFADPARPSAPCAGLSGRARRRAGADHRSEWRRQGGHRGHRAGQFRVRDGPFVTVNCGALPSELIEAELFGAEAGAYTGANKAREGKFEAADGGTLFLDEIGNLPLAGQMKLLRVLETGKLRAPRREPRTRGEGARAQRHQCRPAGDDPPGAVPRGPLLPPQPDRDRAARRWRSGRDDILPLAEHFLGDGKRLADDARAALQRHDWPGNVRELKNTISRAKLLATGDTLHVRDLGLTAAPAQVGHAGPAPDRGEPDRDSIEAALTRANGVIAQAAAELGLSRQALYRRMERLGIDRT